jgi:hypothetical protein
MSVRHFFSFDHNREIVSIPWDYNPEPPSFYRIVGVYEESGFILPSPVQMLTSKTFVFTTSRKPGSLPVCQSIEVKVFDNVPNIRFDTIGWQRIGVGIYNMPRPAQFARIIQVYSPWASAGVQAWINSVTQEFVQDDNGFPFVA